MAQAKRRRKRKIFSPVYLTLVLTFGFTLLTSDIAIGRRTAIL